LLAGGIERERLASVHAPVGLDIGAETPVEIAVSIAAQLVQVRRGLSRGTMASDARVLERMFPENAAQ
jgi:xanthine dehydrogenase accessory factor